MKIKGDVLIQHLSKAASVANYKDAKGIVKVKIKHQEGGEKSKINFFGADGIHTVLTNLEVEKTGLNEGEFFIDARRVINFLKNLGNFTSEDISIKLGECLSIETGKVKFDFPLEPVNGYPEIPEMDLKEATGDRYLINVNAMEFKRKLGNLSRVTGIDSTKPYLQMSDITVTDTSLDMISFDGYRLGRTSLNCSAINLIDNQPLTEQIKINLNPTVVSRLISAVEGATIAIIIMPEMIYIVDADGAITMRRSNLEFPDTRKLMPEVDFASGTVPYKTIWEVDGKAINNSIALIKSVIANEKERLILFELDSESSKLMSEKSKDAGAIQLEGTVTGDSIKIKFNAALLDVLQNGMEKLRICFLSPEQPVYIYDASEDSKFTSRFMILPVR